MSTDVFYGDVSEIPSQPTSTAQLRSVCPGIPSKVSLLVQCHIFGSNNLTMSNPLDFICDKCRIQIQVFRGERLME